MLSTKTRKIILWLVIIILASVLFFLWLKNFQKQVASFQGEKLLEGLNLPQIEMPKLPEINYAQEATTTE